MSTAALQQGDFWFTNSSRPGIRISQEPFKPESQTFEPSELVFTADKPTPVTIPLDALRIKTVPFSGGMLADEGFHYEHVAGGMQTDSHLWEPWSDPVKPKPGGKY